MQREPERIFSADSMLWRICREHAILLHGPAAAVMQIAHPRIGLGVLQHSDFQTAPLARLMRTLDAVYTMTFGTRAEALSAAGRVREIHRRVNGDATAHNVPGKSQYSAFEPDLLMWVIATMIMSSVDGYERAVTTLSDHQKQQFYSEMRQLGTLFDLSADYGPQTWREFLLYWQEQLASPELGAHSVSRKVAWAVARPKSSLWLRISSWPLIFMFSEILPEPVRSRLGFRSTPITRFLLTVATFAMRLLVKLAPARLRFAPHYIHACSQSPATPIAIGAIAEYNFTRRLGGR
jgi:uncharacterized protein (DUF2236 family)